MLLESIKLKMVKSRTARLVRECKLLTRTLPLSPGASAFVRVDGNRIDVMKAILTGPQGSPYAFGAFLFDVFFPLDYPHNPPLVNLETTGHGTCRFNPNLYTDGYVNFFHFAHVSERFVCPCSEHGMETRTASGSHCNQISIKSWFPYK